MKTFPLPGLTLQEAKELQFRLVDEITREFRGSEILTRGDLGVVKGLNKPRITEKVEKVLARFFRTDSCMLVRGAGTNAIRMALFSCVNPGDHILVHDAPIYPTTQTTIDLLNLQVVRADFNRTESIVETLESNPNVKAALIQYTRQKMDDRYDMKAVIETIKSNRPNLPVVTDDNYAALKVKRIGAELGADLSCFSLFKLLGPEGIGCIVGKAEYIRKLVRQNYSGGLQVQGYEALEALQGLIYAPVMLAIQAEVNERLVTRLNNKEIAGVKRAFLANAQSKVLLVEFEQEIAEKVLEEAEKLGAAPYPVGAESRYEFVPMFYRVSGTFLAAVPALEKRMIRINPMRSGEETVLRILKSAIEKAVESM
ncbi:hypothetical protein JIR001_10980 [Polycladomyces abyssicola]|uniref:Aminotransferase n=1 Tax=Polycladomyces abyssicola TaxID=1125966 RepID=A0A8D5ZM63_9BACL|nr:aminotransferase class V-fold PLP-dependent enzyme [Polycladomyces abyssicola]BCU81315.1 hypothetical protein JIR001_10980 [Polycladomyces abyssicola]